MSHPSQDERIAAIEAENRHLRYALEAAMAQNALLLQRVQDLEARLAKDSHNSGKPPSSDGLARKTRSLRKTRGKKPGGQLGHRGETLRLVHLPDAVVEHRPECCMNCQAPLEGAPVVVRERRQVHDLPVLRLVIREHQALHVACPQCQTITIGSFPAEAPSRAQYGPHLRAFAVYLVQQQLVPYGRVRSLLRDVFGQQLSLGTLVSWVQQAATTLAPVERAITAALRQAPLLHSDETGVRRTDTLAWAHVASTPRLTHYAIHAKRGGEALAAIGILPGFTGISVHDGWAAYRANATCRHALCNIHHLRELTFLEEQYQQTWAKDLKRVLLEMKTAADLARAQGCAHLAPAEREAFVARYRALLATGLAANPPPLRRPRQRGRVKQSPAQNLLKRLWLRQDQVLAFLDDLTIPFDNNQAERDLRMLKVQQKISGAFRSEHGAAAFARIRGYLSSLAKQGMALLPALEAIFGGQPLYPNFA
ncbi:MAG: IS66 family transposase [Ktedonobacterales bacterium]